MKQKIKTPIYFSIDPDPSQPKVSPMVPIQKAPPTNNPIFGFKKSHERMPFLEPVKKSSVRNTTETIKLKINQKKQKKQSLLAPLFKSIDNLICDFMDTPLRPSIDPKHVLSGNFAPTDELPPTPCDVAQGSIPSCLDGVYLLDGPNPQFVPRGPYHLFDGDGMLHMIKISGGEATFCSRYVKTYKYMLERDMGYPIIPSPFSSFNGVLASIARVGLSLARVVAGEFDPLVNGYGTANISAAVIGGKLYAIGENDLPYEIKVTSDGDIITLGRHDFHHTDKEFEFLSMTAHPKTDPETGEAFAFRYHFSSPHLTYFRIDSHGRKQPDVPIFSMKNTALIHDFAVTKHYAVFNDVQMAISPNEILKGKPPMRVDLEKTPRLGVIKKYAKDESEMWWVDAPGLNISHGVNAWEEDDGDTLVLVATIISSVEHALERMDSVDTKMEEIRISVKRKKIMLRRQLSTKVLEMPVINPAYAGKKNRYAYAAQVTSPMINAGIVKVDLSLSSNDCHDCIVGSRLYGPGYIGNEPFFVPREPNNPAADEDDGFVVAYVHDENAQESKFLVMDAKSPTLEIVAVVKLPGRVPCGFHGLFIHESQLIKL
ncbi:probable carotenoid cleavage dioxygenase 4 chloroplastic [Phtheirospermum japonicum]|uniref:Probable carotenoid cleavage dioxygenase 4 chloroplastic n=1 Tax=Phtheirospermum japonicum TaxID=374723 RepID=A0A830BX57_9LAMI|nr:probable carotenoid cleavage dioxygenase 4 chloroplastic [Phtheirospermum japonicum]